MERRKKREEVTHWRRATSREEKRGLELRENEGMLKGVRGANGWKEQEHSVGEIRWLTVLFKHGANLAAVMVVVYRHNRQHR